MNRETVIYGVAGAVGLSAAAATLFLIGKKVFTRCHKVLFLD